MLSIKEIEKFYPENLRPFKRNLLREYLQYKILEIIFTSKLAYKLSFLGGTCLRIVHNNSRFSEDLDFDNFDLTEENFNEISKVVREGLHREGYEVEVRNVYKGAYRCYIRMPNLLFNNQLSGHEEEVILIQLDTAPHSFTYQPDKPILNKFDVFTQVFATPIDIILSQKFYAVFNRRTLKGRDFFDIVFLVSRTRPNYRYLKEKLSISNGNELKKALEAHLKDVDMGILIRDVEPFLFNLKDSSRILLFKEYIQQADL